MLGEKLLTFLDPDRNYHNSDPEKNAYWPPLTFILYISDLEFLMVYSTKIAIMYKMTINAIIINSVSCLTVNKFNIGYRVVWFANLICCEFMGVKNFYYGRRNHQPII
ncbi:hypothetical protein RIR_jg27708.t1 [Rhizophagus irregularis DAOM 181602=DAOM 197198]|uniref:Uncharacterized protein n=1 Tax=Rhizophagus irregularis (strain DAOM 197198w) TaxID=1432141 RepID=A0A015I8P6_RHIIW|nr:hypothetical protein RirG_273730 [Rhizophagus irregularis DAOM 197198w]GBC52860.1 hypothetical protein RIR_jg27708.t1 [Rhizophagus irregularis DAOM 181602=DAOM 197198]